MDGGRADQASGAPGFAAAGTGQPQPVANNRPNFLTARKNGFLFDNNGMQGVSITPEQSDVTIALVPEARIVGHVNLAGSGEASGMRVQLYRRQVLQGRAHWDPMGNAEVRSDGEFRFADLSAGSYKVFTEESLDRDPVTSNRRAQVFGYPPVYFPAAAGVCRGRGHPIVCGRDFPGEPCACKTRILSGQDWSHERGGWSSTGGGSLASGARRPGICVGLQL